MGSEACDRAVAGPALCDELRQRLSAAAAVPGGPLDQAFRDELG